MSITDTRADELREARHPVFSDRKLRLGTFSSNLSFGCAISTIDGTLRADWPSTATLARMADEMDFEALVPVGRWRGFGGTTDFNGEGFECFTWAAATAAQTERAGIFATSHVPTIHPILAAKQGMTVDHVSGGRFALNVVTGWHKPEIEMFGAPQLEHDQRYALAAEWLSIIKRLWTEDEPFDFEGRYFKVDGAVCRPHPLQSPHPVIMNAGGSDAGRHFAAKECDVAFVIPDAHDADSMRARVDHYRRLAREEYGREIQVWSYAYVVQGDTEQEARDYLRRYVDELGDWDAADNLVGTMGMNAQTLPPDVLQDMKRHFIAGWGATRWSGARTRSWSSSVSSPAPGSTGACSRGQGTSRTCDGSRRRSTRCSSRPGCGEGDGQEHDGGERVTSMQTRADELREAKHPVYSERTLRLGTFGQNLQQGCAITSIDGALEATWPSTLEVARIADRMGFEALVSVGRWRGFGGKTDFNGAGFEPFTWASGIGAATEQAGVFSTSHVPTIHPILAAKQAATIDHVTNGRFALNVVTGWHQAEIEMFGAPLLPHDERYEVAREWLHIIRTMWTAEEPFDFEGRYYKVEGAVCRPQPIQKPHPVVMNAGGSEAGRHFGASQCDVVFALTGDHSFDALKAQVDAFRDLARTEYDREISVWCNAYIVQGDTEQDAKDYFHSYVYDHGDWDAVENLVTTFGIQSQSLPPEVARAMKEHFIAGWGGIPVIGTAEQIVEGLRDLTRAGFDGVLLSWARYIEDMRRFEQEVHPLLLEAGLR